MKSESGTEHGALAETLALAQQPRRRRRETDAVALELLERVDAALQRGQRFVGAEQLCARDRLALARLAIGRARRLHLAGGGRGGALRGVHLHLQLVVLPTRDRERVVELRLLLRERVGALAHLVELAHRALALVLHAPHAVLQLAQLALGVLHGVARFGDDSPRFVLRLLMPRELRLGGARARASSRVALRGCALALGGDLHARLLARRRFGLGALASRGRVALPFLGDGHLAADALHLLALRAHEARQLVALRLRGGARAVRLIARRFGIERRRLGGRQLLAQLGEPRLEPRELLAPRLHLARRRARARP